MKKGGSAYTARTTAFATATSISDTVILNALNTLDLTGIFDDGRINAFFPRVGGTSFTCKFNFINVATFVNTYSGGWTFNSNGQFPNGTNATCDTGWNPTTQASSNKGGYGIYLRSNTSDAKTPLMAYGSGVYFGLFPYNSISRMYYCNNNLATIFETPTIYHKFQQSSRLNSSTNLISAETQQWTETQTTSSTVNANVLTGGNSAVGYSSVGEGSTYLANNTLSLSEQLTIRTAVIAFETSLGRNV
jgi:hypothetical protein